jgi:hypothetical protein
MAEGRGKNEDAEDGGLALEVARALARQAAREDFNRMTGRRLREKTTEAKP